MPRFSIIMPVLGDPSQMEDSLVSVLENRPANCEILVVINRPYTDPYALAEEVCFIEAPRGSRLVDSINLGIAVSHAPIVHLLPCGLQVSEGWADQALKAMAADARVAAVTPVVLDRSRPERILSAGVRYHTSGRVRRVSPKLIKAVQSEPLSALADPAVPAVFYRKSALDAVGRFSGMVGDQLACVDLALTLEHAGFRCVVEPRCHIYSASPKKPCESGFRRGWAAERLFWRWAPRGSLWKTLPLHLATVAIECISTLPYPATLTQLAGRLVGSLQISAHRRHWQALEQQQAKQHPAELQNADEAHPTALPVEAPHFLTHSAQRKKKHAA